jgi:tRNA pseudouridine38-40 synthase
LSRRRVLRLVVEYDGTHFFGWQKQRTVRTVQGELEEALQFVLQHPVSLVAAGRTDAGVHALAQVASFRTSKPIPEANLLAASNSLTGRDLRVHALEEAPERFHARWSARWRHYTYVLARRPSALLRHRAHCPEVWPRLEPMVEACRLLVGRRDMSGLSNRSPDNRQPVCLVHEVGWGEWAGGLVFHIRADHFLYRMVRTIVGTCLEIGRARWGPERMREILESRDRRLAGPPAPPDGLYFTGVGYDPPWEAAARPAIVPWWGEPRNLETIRWEKEGQRS